MGSRKIPGRHLARLLLVAMALASPAYAGNVNIADGLPSVQIRHDGKIVNIARIQNEENVLNGGFAKTSRKCPPFCIHPISVAPGVKTVGELELLEFLKNRVEKGSGLLIDARTPSWYQKGTIPGSVNIPFTVFGLDLRNPELTAALRQLGARPGTTVNWSNSEFGGDVGRPARFAWDFSQAKDVMLFCNGPWCDQSPRAIKGLLDIGYPASKIQYYRGGMQLWLLFGLNVHVP
jgi:rhodanese-related sulfurtransferase